MKIYLFLLITFLVQCSMGHYLETRANTNDNLPVIEKYYNSRVNVTELSGLKLSATKDFLWGIGDEGQLAQISFRYKVTLMENFKGVDSEGITIDPKTEDLIVCIEPNRVSRITKSSNYTVIKDIFTVKDANGWKKFGLEGITLFNKTQIYVGAQKDALLWHYDIKGNLIKKYQLKNVASKITEIADLSYDEEKNRLWVLDSELRSIFLFNGEITKLLKTYSLNETQIYNPESIAIDRENGNIWIGEDRKDNPKLFRLKMRNL
ncbi:hypothetical protein BCR32DRAFT_251133 [Anaeromyces robustus]|uniref:NHL repeat-containing protein n=1 Tax=Anaeromyces robustus TaxID=1754192 RepID=A0A1Y1VT62_9FUNG|nr:hypothetical protein BCR32DRAFT_251133 [Anaeromyces robustus]|eukprot:ORX64373.1 hypothetical protein BCR32DRAFT_251133 [Anaeromyces robustus]